MDLRAIIFDYGKVLSAPADPVAHSELVAIAGLPVQTFEHHYWANRDAFDRGELTGVTYWQKVGRDAGIALSDAQIERLIRTDVRMWTSLNEPMIAWAGQLQRAGFRTAILSNIGDALVEAMLKEFAWLKGFDYITWSYEHKLAKPDLAIYRHTVEQLGIRPEQALFLDDKAENIRGAEAAGMHGIVFHSLPQLVGELKQRGYAHILPLPA